MYEVNFGKGKEFRMFSTQAEVVMVEGSEGRLLSFVEVLSRRIEGRCDALRIY